MPFLRFSRDKRGYEHFYLVQPSGRRGKSRSRILYWFRTPPNVRVGREPFDDTIRRTLEAQNPDVTFDWQKLLDTPIPPAEPERWRERRRAERAAKHVADDEETAETAADGDEVEREEPVTDELPLAELPGVDAAELTSSAVPAAPPAAETPEPSAPARRRRRRRRGRRGRRSAEAVQAPVSGSGQSSSAERSGEVAEPREPGERLKPFEPLEAEKRQRDV